MSALNALAQDYALATHIKRVSEAAGWIDAARPIVKAYLALDALENELERGCYDVKLSSYERVEAVGVVVRAYDHLYEMLTDIRNRFIEDASAKQPPETATEEEWDALVEANDALAAETLTVEQAIKRIEREDQ